MSGASGNRRSRRHQLSASHQKNWLTGRYAVLEMLRAARWPATELFVSMDVDEAIFAEVRRCADDRNVRLNVESEARITELCHSEHHQGLAARMGAFPYHTADWLVGESSRQHSGRIPLVVICDRIQDTHNFGAIIRCCDGMGVQAVVVSAHEQARVTPQVARSSAGAVNHVPLVLVSELTQTAADLRNAGFRLAAASEHSQGEAWEADLNQPVALIVGSEANGVSSSLLALCDDQLRIPMMGSISSLNAAVAAGMLLYEIRRQQRPAA